MPTSLPAKISPLTEREAVIDAVYRMVEALDTTNEELFDATWTEDAVFDGTPLADVLGVPVGRMEGVNQIRTAFVQYWPYTSSHMTTNHRVNIGPDSKTATLTCYALAQHLHKETSAQWTGPVALGGVRYWIELVKADDGLWKIKLYVVKPIWMHGDKSVMGAK